MLTINSPILSFKPQTINPEPQLGINKSNEKLRAFGRQDAWEALQPKMVVEFRVSGLGL